MRVFTSTLTDDGQGSARSGQAQREIGRILGESGHEKGLGGCSTKALDAAFKIAGNLFNVGPTD